jgi:hypothetical protein
MGLKSEKLFPAPQTSSIGLVGCLNGLFEASAHVNKPRDVLYRGVELASSFLGLQKLTYLLWLRLQAKIRSYLNEKNANGYWPNIYDFFFKPPRLSFSYRQVASQI